MNTDELDTTNNDAQRSRRLRFALRVQVATRLEMVQKMRHPASTETSGLSMAHN